MIIFRGGWSDYEEHSYIEIEERDGRYFLTFDAHNVHTGDHQGVREVAHDEALEEMLDFADCEEVEPVYEYNLE